MIFSNLKKLAPGLVGILCDIDDTLTFDGRLEADAYTALWALKRSGLRVIPVTGRPGGWVDQIARIWPVDGVVGENGGLWYWHDGERLQRRFLQSAAERAHNQERLRSIQAEILATVPGAGVASDQPYRELDLAIDFCEDVPPLSDDAVDQIVQVFRKHGATAKISSIHVNGWFGAFDKLTGCQHLIHELFQESIDATQRWLYVGDSANDEPMFAHFPVSVGVANVRPFLPQMSAHPRWIMKEEGGRGFTELAEILLSARQSV